MNLKTKILYSWGILGLIKLLSPFSTPAKAEGLDKIVNSTPTEQTEITIPLKDPAIDYDANTHIFSSLNNVLGKGIEKLGEKTGLDDSVSGRIIIAGLDFLKSYRLATDSHEFAHVRGGSEGGSYKWDLSLFLEPINKRFGYNPTDSQLLTERVAGLNQNEGNSEEIMKNIYLQKKYFC